MRHARTLPRRALQRRHTLSRQSRRHLFAFPLEQRQHLLRARNHGRRQSRQASHLDAVRPIGTTRNEPVQEQHLIAHFAHRHREIAHATQLARELRELVIVRREHGLAPDRIVEVFTHTPGDRHAVVRARAATDFIEQHQRPLGGRVKNRARLAHLHHERRLAAHQIVAGPHAREQAIHDRQCGSTGRYIRANLRHELDQANLAQDGTLARHVRTSQHDHLTVLAKHEIVRDELLPRHHPLHHRMTSRHNLHVEAIVQLRTRVLLALRHVRECREHVDRRHPPRHLLPPPDRRARITPQRIEQLALARLDPIGGAEHFLLVLLERRRHVAFGPRQRLTSLIIVGDQVLVGVRDLEEVPEHAIVSDLERVDAGTRALLRLDRRDRILAPVAQRAQRIELGIHARRDGVLFTDQQRRPFHQHRREPFGAVATIVPIVEHRGQQPAARIALGGMRQHSAHRVGHLRQARQRITEGAQLTWGGAAGRRFAGQSLHVTHAIKRLAQAGAPDRIAHQHRHRIETPFNGTALEQRRQQPLPQHALPHGRGRAIEHRQQRARQLTTAQRLH